MGLSSINPGGCFGYRTRHYRIARAATRILKKFGVASSTWQSDLLYIAAGCVIFIIGMKALMMPHQLLVGGLAGVVLLLQYFDPGADMGRWYLLLNLPLIWLGWQSVGRRFMSLTIFGMLFFSFVAIRVEPGQILIQNRMVAALTAGLVCGLGSGLILSSRGSAGGFDVLSIVLSRKVGLCAGDWIFALSCLPLIVGGWFFEWDIIVDSCLFYFICSRVVKVVMAGTCRQKVLAAVPGFPQTAN